MNLPPAIVLEAFSDKWMFSNEEYLLANFMLLNSALSGNAIQTPAVEAKVNYNSGSGDVSEGSIAIIDIRGAITKADHCGDPGTATYTSWIKQLDINPDVKGLILRVDSGGGALNGTYELVKAIESFSKPTASLVEDIAGSAAYWPVAKTDRVFFQNDLSLLGSVGVFRTAGKLVPQQMINGLSVEMQTIYSRLSPLKNKGSRQLQDTGETTLMEDEVTFLDSFFMDSIKASRPNISQAALDGDTFYGADAIANGIADEMGDLNAAIQFINTQSTTTSPADMSKTMMEIEIDAFTALNSTIDEASALFGDAAQAEGFSLATAITEMQTAHATALEAVNATVTAHEATIEANNTELTKLRQLPGASAAIEGDDAPLEDEPEALSPQEQKFAAAQVNIQSYYDHKNPAKS